MSLLNVLTGGMTENPDWHAVGIDPATTALINQQAAQGNKSQSQIQQEQLFGTSQTMAPAMGGAVGQQQATMGGGGLDAATTQALNNRANRLYSGQYNQLQNQAAAQAPITQAHLMNQGVGALQQQQNVNDQLNRNQMYVTAKKNDMRNQVIGQLFGGAGAIGGMYAGSKAGQSSPSGNGQSTQSQLDQMNASSGPQDPGFGSHLNNNNSSYGLGVSKNGLG